ncbi:MAG TPA: hypothetical protein VGT44_06345 [Ktedonobacteraceae bacterium]|nr:hypothetical protein [Ktedonobacteraceae bacterium]
MQQQSTTQTKQRLFTATEVAQFEYCPLVWWHEQFGPLAHMDTEELFARMVELEHEYGQQAVAMPEYEAIENLLLRQGAFEDGRRQHEEHAEEVEKIEEETRISTGRGRGARVLVVLAIVLVILALVMIVAAVLVR